MKLRNKKTGEIVEATDFNIISDYNSLAELNAEWEDVPEEPKDIQCKDGIDNVLDMADQITENNTNVKGGEE